MGRIAARRHAAAVRRLAVKYQQERLTLMDPLFNVREILKQCVLLEDHLLHPYKLCPDCIHKHLLTIEALGDEGVTLDTPNGVYTDALEGVAEFARGTMENFHDGESPAEIAQQVRQLRKILTPVACDPRSTINRIASVYLMMQEAHPH